MEINGTFKPGLAPQITETKPADRKAVVQPELSSGRSVIPVDKAESGKLQDRQSTQSDKDQVRVVDFDAETKDVVYRSMDISTGDVVWQFPAESLIRLREYLEHDAPRADSGVGPNAHMDRQA